ncbi:MAG: hypothetical protein AAF587_06410 [Bacteroidota bacterium]
MWYNLEEQRLEEADYPDEVGEIVVNSCAITACHIGEDSPESLDLSSWSLAFEGSEFGSVIIPGTPQWSHLFQHINTFEELGIRALPTMPIQEEDRLDRTQVTIIKDWIENGALNREGKAYWETQTSTSGGKLFTLCANSDLIAVSDIASNLIMRFIPVGQNPAVLEAPHFLTLSPDEQYMYVTLISGNALEKYRTDTYELVGRVALSASPALVQIGANGTRAIVTHYNTSHDTPKLSMINTTDMSLIQEVNGGTDFLGLAHGVRINEAFTRVFVGAGASDEYAVLEIDETGFKSVIDTYPVDPSSIADTLKPYQLYLLEQEDLLFITCNKGNQVRVFRPETGELVKVIDVARFPRLMEYDPESKRMFVACAKEENFSEQGALEGCISVIDVANLVWERNIYRVGQRPHGVSVDVVGRRLYVSSENTGGQDPPHHPLEGNTFPPGKYNVIDLNTLEVLRDEETEVAEFPNALVVTRK